MDTQKNQIAESLKQANNILVTVSNNPSVDQLSAAIGVTLLLNKLGKHAIAVFSGKVPSTIEFLQPEKTLEKTTDSLRDFIIALDKSKADKLRYKVEDQMVKIFITPYHTSITEEDLEFSQGDFNVEVVLAIGVNEQADLDHAITSHGRILHDATIVSINTTGNGNLGGINWLDAETSSLCEMLVSLSSALSTSALDEQMATAFLTGIVAETNRFSNEKTRSETMQISAQLMSAGANQQLVATQLQQPSTPVALADEDADHEPADGALDIDHELAKGTDAELPEPEVEQIQITEDGEMADHELELDNSNNNITAPPSNNNRGLTLEPPTLGGKLTANTEPEGLDPSTDPFGANTNNQPLLSRSQPAKTSPVPLQQPADKEVVPEPVPAEIPDLKLPPLPTVLPTAVPVSDVSIPVPLPSSSDISATDIPMPPPVTPTPPTPPPVPTEFTQPVPEPPQTLVPLAPEPVAPPQEPPKVPDTTLEDLEKTVASAHVAESIEAGPELEPAPAEPVESLDAARDAVMQAVQGTEQPREPIMALNAQPMELDLTQLTVPDDLPEAKQPEPEPTEFESPPEDIASDDGLPPGLIPPAPTDNTASQVTDPTAPPPVPPPLLPMAEPPTDQPPAGNTDNENPLAPPVL